MYNKINIIIAEIFLKNSNNCIHIIYRLDDKIIIISIIINNTYNICFKIFILNISDLFFKKNKNGSGQSGN